MNEKGNDGNCLINYSKLSIGKRAHHKKSEEIAKLRQELRTPPMPANAPLQLDINVSASSPDLRQMNCSFQDDNLPILLNNTKKQIKNENTGTSTCNMCCRAEGICVNLQNSHRTVLAVSEITRLPSWNIREIVSSICSRCLLYVTAVADSSSKLRLRCEQAMQSQAVVLAPPTPDTSPNNFIQLSSTLLDDSATGNGEEVQQQRNCYTPSYCDDVTNHLTLPPVSPPIPYRTLDAISHSTASSNAGNNDSMLKIQYERPVSPLNTESGGGGKNKKQNYQRMQIITAQMICSHCNISYKRKDYYNKHKRKCAAKHRYAKSLIASQTRNQGRITLDAISVISEGADAITYSSRLPRVYRCNQCTVTVENIGKLRQHKRIHLPRLYCDICSNEFTTQNEYDFHRVQCIAKMEVFENGLENIKSDVNSPVTVPARRKTRSYSRAASLAPSIINSQTRSNKNIKSAQKTPAKRSRIQKEDERSTIYNFVKHHKHLYNSEETENYEQQNIDGNEDDDIGSENNEDDDDDTSQVDTLYSRRLYLTNQWVEEHSLSSHSHLSRYDNYIEDYREDLPFRSLKEYDLNLLDRLKVELKHNSLTCFMPGCTFNSENLNDLMVHDYMYHLKKPRFYCHKCGYCFTSKVFLDYHLDLQNKGRYVCYKCGSHFEYQHKLDRHLIQHERFGEKYVCKYCNYSFLDENKLIKHCYEENHPADKEKPTIKINTEMTITNKVPDNQENSYKKNNTKKYKVKILDMILKPMPSKRCTPIEKYNSHLPPNKRIQKRIGEVEFRDPLNPNCVSCL